MNEQPTDLQPELQPVPGPQIQISVTHEGASISTPSGLNMVSTFYMPEQMIKDIYSQMMFHQKEQARKDQDIIRAMKNSGRIK